MKKIQKIIAVFLSVFMLSGVATYAFEVDKNFEKSKDFPIIVPFSSDLVVDEEDISENGVDFNLVKPYRSFRIHVNNTTQQKMTVTILNSSGNQVGRFTVKKNSSKTYRGNNRPRGSYSIDFQTPDGVPEGTVSVRVSESNF